MSSTRVFHGQNEVNVSRVKGHVPPKTQQAKQHFSELDKQDMQTW